MDQLTSSLQHAFLNLKKSDPPATKWVQLSVQSFPKLFWFFLTMLHGGFDHLLK